MSYAHDAFVSYPSPYREWVEECFLPELRRYLTEELEHPADVFFDRTGTRTGDAWRQRIRREVTTSRCLVAIWSPRYFQSEWCRFESSIILYREAELGYRTLDKPEGLVFPIKAFDGDRFPSFAKDIQCFDCRNFVRSAAVFKTSQRFLEFQDSMVDWVPTLGTAIRTAPPWEPKWLTESWLGNAIAYRPEESSVDFPAPILR